MVLDFSGFNCFILSYVLDLPCFHFCQNFQCVRNCVFAYGLLRVWFSKVLVPNIFVNYWIISHKKSDLRRILQLSSMIFEYQIT
jgi:hypothetical protein